MGKVIVGLSVSLDGYIAGPDDGAEFPLGRGGEALFAWMDAGPESNRLHPYLKPPDKSMVIVKEWIDNAGAMISGRRVFDIAGGWADGHPIDVPNFVVTHNPPTEGEWSSQCRFVPEGVEAALKLAQDVAGDKVVSVAGANVAQQVLRAGKLDEIQVSITPVILGGGVSLFATLPLTQLEQKRVIESDGVTHIDYRVL